MTCQVLTRQPEEMTTMPFKLFRCFISGKIDDRLHQIDLFLVSLMATRALSLDKTLSVAGGSFTSRPTLPMRVCFAEKCDPR